MHKRVIIIHGWKSHPEDGWFPYVKKELETRGFAVIIPNMPTPDAPDMKTWVPAIAQTVGTPDTETLLIGHSAGAIATMRYIEHLDKSARIGGVILVAGPAQAFTERAKKHLLPPIDWKKLCTHSRHYVALYSDNDRHIPLKHADIMREKLGARVIIKHGLGHFSGVWDNCFELPEVVEVAERIIG